MQGQPGRGAASLTTPGAFRSARARRPRRPTAGTARRRAAIAAQVR